MCDNDTVFETNVRDSDGICHTTCRTVCKVPVVISSNDNKPISSEDLAVLLYIVKSTIVAKFNNEEELYPREVSFIEPGDINVSYVHLDYKNRKFEVVI